MEETQSADAVLFAKVVELLRRQKTDPSLRTELSEAKRKLEEFLAAQQDSVPALRLVAEVCQRLGDLARTRHYIHQAELLDPWNLEILIISESLYEEEARQPRAPGQAPMPDSEIASGTVSTERLIERAMGSFRLGQLERSYSLAKLAFRIEPDKGHHLLDVWTVGAALDPHRTRRELIRLLPEAQQQPYLFLALGSINTVMGLYEEAAGWLERGLALELTDRYVHAMLLNELAYVLIRRDSRLSAAVQYARRALELFPDKAANGFIRDTLGLAYLKLGELEKASRNLLEAVAKDPSPIPRFHLALVLIHDHRPADALTELRAIARARYSLESPHLEEIAILDRVQTHIARLEDLLNLGGANDLRDALSILAGLV